MRNRLNLSPKAKTTVGLKRTLVYASIGAGIFVMLFTGAFFYLNMGNSEELMAAEPVFTAKVIKSGIWGESATWLNGKLPKDNDTILVPPGTVLTIDDTKNFQNISLRNTTLVVHGTIFFNKGKLTLTGLSQIILYEGSEVNAVGQPGHNHLNIGNASLKTNDLIELKTPRYFDWNSNKLGEEIPKNKLPALLPIVLDYFTAAVTPSNSVLVEWGTVSEIDNDFFTLERSSDGKTFESIATVEGAGNSLRKLQYSFEDKKSTVGMNYYRLKQTDYNGDFEYFKIVGVNNTLGSTQNAVSAQKMPLIISEAYPNPFKNELNLSFEAEGDGGVEIMLQDSRGEIVHKEVVPYYYGINDYKFTKGDQLRPGVYYISLWNSGKKIKTQRLIKM